MADNYSGFGTSTKMSSKERVLGKLNKWEKQEQAVYMGISLRRKIIDGKTVTVMSLDRNGPVGIGEIRPLPREFTDRTEFKKELDLMIDSIEKQL